MHIERLSLTGFRNLVQQEISFPKRVTIIVGNNGQGKTNLLEAVYLLSQSRSFRSSSARDLISWESGIPSKSCSVDALVKSSSGAKEIKYEISGSKRVVFVNKKHISKASKFYGQVRVVEFGSHDLDIVKGAPVCRRRFMDRVIAMVDESFVDSSVAYSRALKSRNAVIRSGLARRQPRDKIKTQLVSWDQSLAENGAIVASKRFGFIREIEGRFRDYHKRLSVCDDSGVDVESADISYKSEFVENGEVLGKAAISDLFHMSHDSDLANSRTSSGVQRDDLGITIDTGAGYKTARTSASQGQTRSLVLALKLATVDFLSNYSDESPVLLLDDIESELDLRRRQALYELVARSNSQIVITLTEMSAELEKSIGSVGIINISNGLVSIDESSIGSDVIN